MPRARRQPYLPGFEAEGESRFGGSLLGRSNPTLKRPMPRQRAVHLVMRASSATGARSFLAMRHAKRVDQIVRKTAKLRGVQLHRFANSGNHLHLIIQAPSRTAYVSYIRAISGLVARLVTAKQRGKGRQREAQESRGRVLSSPPSALIADNTTTRENSPSATTRPRAGRFWDARPFTRIIAWGRDFRRVCGYLRQNRLEALGFIAYRPRGQAKRNPPRSPPGGSGKQSRKKSATARRA